MWKEKIKKLFPKTYSFYRKVLANLAAFFYHWPSEKLLVIGVTGTAGKSTVVNLITKIFEDAGFRVGMISSSNFRINKKERPNIIRMTMPGPFYLQRLLYQMVKENCQCAVIETTSQGLIQWRHYGINYDLAVITNLLPEHLESHGSFEQYKQAKGLLFKSLSKKRKETRFCSLFALLLRFVQQGFAKVLRRTKSGVAKDKKIKVINLDDKEADYFLNFKSDLTYGFSLNSNNNKSKNCQKVISPIPGWEIKENGLEFIIKGTEFKTNLLSKFNLYNSLAAITTCFACGISLEKMKRSLAEVEKIPGRFEIIIDKPFKVVVDYAHTPDELFGVYNFFSAFAKGYGGSTEALREGGKKVLPGSCQNRQRGKLIVVFGSCGGGRDKWKRKVLGEIADKFADEIILTNEDPYDEEPGEIIEQVAIGIRIKKNFYKILDRREAIRKALRLASVNDIILITGKGVEKSIMSRKGKKIPWSDKEVVEEELKKLR